MFAQSFFKIALGTILYKVTEKVKKIDFTKASKPIMTLSVLYRQYKFPDKFPDKFFYYIERLSLLIYLNYYLVIKMINICFFDYCYFLKLIIVVVVTIVLSVIVM